MIIELLLYKMNWISLLEIMCGC